MSQYLSAFAILLMVMSPLLVPAIVTVFTVPAWTSAVAGETAGRVACLTQACKP